MLPPLCIDQRINGLFKFYTGTFPFLSTASRSILHLHESNSKAIVLPSTKRQLLLNVCYGTRYQAQI